MGIGFPCQSGADGLGHGECEQKGKFALNLREGRGKKPQHTQKIEVLTLAVKLLLSWLGGAVGWWE